MKSKRLSRLKIKRRVRNKISGTADKPRLSVFKSNKQIYCQLIDDLAGVTLGSASSKDLDSSSMAAVEVSKLVGKKIGDVAASKNISEIVFDRNGYVYHGRVKALADGARENGLKF